MRNSLPCLSIEYYVIKTTEFTRVPGNDDLLLVAAGNLNGSGKVWYKPLLAELASSTVTVVDLPGEVSSACGLRHPSRCRTLVVNSTQCDAYVSRHIVFVPLESEFDVLEITHNGSALGGSNYTSFERLQTIQRGTPCPVNCTSVGMFKIRAHYYSLCATLSSIVCTCQLSRQTIDSTEYLLSNCQQFDVRIAAVVDHISNIVSSSNPRQPYLFFFVSNALFRLSPVDRILSYINEVSQCSSVDQLTMEENKLFIYCANNVSAVYDLNIGRLLALYLNGQERHYQCSSTTNITISIGTDSRTSNLTYISEDAILSVPLPRGVIIEYGTCFVHEGDPIFLYLDQRNGVHLFNVTASVFTHLNHTSACEGNSCQWPQVFHNTYLIAKNSMRDSLTVYDIERNLRSPILNLDNVPYQAVALIDELQISRPIQTSSTTSTLFTSPMPTPSPVFTGVTLTQKTSLGMFSIQTLPSSLPVISPSPDDPIVSNEFELAGTIAFVAAVLAIIIVIIVLLIAAISLKFNSKR